MKKVRKTKKAKNKKKQKQDEMAYAVERVLEIQKKLKAVYILYGELDLFMDKILLKDDFNPEKYGVQLVDLVDIELRKKNRGFNNLWKRTYFRRFELKRIGEDNE